MVCKSCQLLQKEDEVAFWSGELDIEDLQEKTSASKAEVTNHFLYHTETGRLLAENAKKFKAEISKIVETQISNLPTYLSNVYEKLNSLFLDLYSHYEGEEDTELKLKISREVRGAGELLIKYAETGEAPEETKYEQMKIAFAKLTRK